MLTKADIERDRKAMEDFVERGCRLTEHPAVRGILKQLRAMLWDAWASHEELRKALADFGCIESYKLPSGSEYDPCGKCGPCLAKKADTSN